MSKLINCREYAKNIKEYQEAQRQWVKANNITVGSLVQHKHGRFTMYPAGFLDDQIDISVNDYDYTCNIQLTVEEINTNSIVCHDENDVVYYVPYTTLTPVLNKVTQQDFEDGKFYKCVESPDNYKDWTGHIVGVVQGKVLAYSLPDNESRLSCGLRFVDEHKFVEVSKDELSYHK